MKKNSNTYKLAVCAIMVALGAVLSLVKVVQMPFGGSVTLLSMLPCAMVSVMLGLKWGLAASFVESVIQLAFGITMDGVLGWGLTPAMLIGTILLDYILAYTVIGLAGAFRSKGYVGICVGTGLAVFLRFVCHLISGAVIFAGGLAFAGQIMPPEKRPIVTGLQMAFNGIGSMAAPVIAGACVDAGNWRLWVGIALALFVIVTILYIIFYPRGVKTVAGEKADGVGVALLTILFVALAFLLQLSGTYWPGPLQLRSPWRWSASFRLSFLSKLKSSTSIGGFLGIFLRFSKIFFFSSSTPLFVTDERRR